MKEPNDHHKIERSEDFLEILNRRHFQGALVRSGASVIMWLFAFAAYLANVIRMNHFAGISLSVLYLILINPPTLMLLKRITNMRLYGYASLLINVLEILGYTAIIYFLGGIEATFLTPIYAALITYVGVMGPRAYTYVIAFLCSAAFSLVVGSEYSGLIPRQTVVSSFNPPLLTILTYLSVVIGLLFVVAYISSLTSAILKKNRNKLRERNFELMEKAAALEKAEKKLQTAHHELERRVEERTAELEEANNRLRIEIDERKQAEDALKFSLSLLDSALESTADGILIVNSQGKVTKCNRKFAEMWKIPQDVIFSHEDNVLLNHVLMQLVDPEQFLAKVREMYSNPEEVSFNQIVFADGRVFERYSQPQKIENMVVGRVWSFRDVTARIQGEKDLRDANWRMEAIIDGTHAGTWEWNVQTGETLFNETWAQLIGYTLDELSPVSIKTWETFSHPDDLKQSDELLKRHFAGELPYYNCECRMKHKDGRWVWVLDRGRVNSRTADGKPLMMFGTHTDINVRKRAEAEIAEREVINRQLQKAESLNRMAGAIAHNFNNQLQVVMGNLEMAMNDQPRSPETLTEAMKAARKAAEVSALMLTYCGQLPGKDEPVNLSAACRQSLAMLQATAPKGAILKADFPVSGPVIHCSTSHIRQVITNLVTNAWEAADENRRDIRLTVKTVSRAAIPASKLFPVGWKPQESVYACLEVADAGCGIACRDIENLFDPFYSTKFTGRGMGLSVVLGIVKAHNGGITVESEPGRGSIFRVFLPLSAKEIPSQADKAAQTPIIQEGGTLLLIEDEEQVRKMAQIMLTRIGFTVLEAKDGVEAVEIFRQHRDEIRCVLSDLTMPRMNGWDTLAALRRLSPDIPVILSSGYDEAQVMAGEHPERPNAVLGKPYQLKGLRETISRVLSAPVHL
jgi:PAS domain S-box-containing protein